MTKYILALIGAVILAVAIYGAYQYPQQMQLVGAIIPGTTANTSKVAEISWSLLSPTATSTSILNTDAQDRIVINSEVFCSGVGTSGAANGGSGGLSSLIITVATSSTAAPASNQNLNTWNNTIPTSTPEVYVSTSTNPVNGADGRRWAANSYMTWTANATNTAQCIVDVKYLQALGV